MFSATNAIHPFVWQLIISNIAFHHYLGAFFPVICSPVGVKAGHFASWVAIVSNRGIVSFGAFVQCAISEFRLRFRSTTQFRSCAASRAFNQQGQAERQSACCFGR